MLKLKVLDKLKPKKKKPEYDDEEQTPSKSEEDAQSKTVQDSKRPVLAEYHETLHSVDASSENKDSSYQREDVLLSSEQRVWRDVKAIEENVDNISKHKLKSSEAGLDKTVDEILVKIKRKLVKAKKTPRKPSNVIYVVSKPQPGQVRGDWAVRSHGKIFSHHRLKENAIKQARNIARERNATVLVQNTDGTFSEGFKPSPNK